jgi:ketosteroid isomerase-like protein
MTTPGEEFARALSTKDEAAVRALMAPDLDFRAMTPGRFWTATNHEELVDVLFGHWLEPSDEVVALLSTATGEVSTRNHVAYRLHLRNADGESVMEQQMYYDVTDGRISWARVMCSGFVRI